MLSKEKVLSNKCKECVHFDVGIKCDGGWSLKEDADDKLHCFTTEAEWKIKKAKGWVSVDDDLPYPDVWVQVFEDDSANPQDYFYCKVHKKSIQRVTVARLLCVDSEGNADWYVFRAGSQIRNVTHWKHLSDAPPEHTHVVKPDHEDIS